MNFLGSASRSPQFIVISDDDDHEKTMNKHGQQHTCTVCMKKFDTFQALISHHYQNLFHKMTASSSSQGCFNRETQQGSDSKPKIHLPQLDYLMMEIPKPITCTMIESQPVTRRMKVESHKSGNVGLNDFNANVPRPIVTMAQSQTQPTIKKIKVANPVREDFDLNVGYENNVTTNHPRGIYQVKCTADNQEIDLNLRL